MVQYFPVQSMVLLGWPYFRKPPTVPWLGFWASHHLKSRISLEIISPRFEEMGGHTVVAKSCITLVATQAKWIEINHFFQLVIPISQPFTISFFDCLWWCLWTSRRNGSNWLECCQFAHDLIMYNKYIEILLHFNSLPDIHHHPSIPSTWTKIAHVRTSLHLPSWHPWPLPTFLRPWISQVPGPHSVVETGRVLRESADVRWCEMMWE